MADKYVGPYQIPRIAADEPVARVSHSEALAVAINNGIAAAEEAVKATLRELFVNDSGGVDDAAVAAFITSDGTASNDAAKGISESIVSKVMQDDQTPEGDWTFGRGITTEGGRARLAVERDFSTANGDLYSAKTRLEFAIRDQAATTQNPPGYSYATVSLIEDGENGSQYQGESARMALISNRILFNRRVEVSMGGPGRAILSAGIHPGEQYARISIHNASFPRLDVNGPNHEGSYGKNEIVADQAIVRVRKPSSSTTSQYWEFTDGSGANQELQVAQFTNGHTIIRAFHGGASGGGIRFQHTDGSVRLYGQEGGIQLNSKTLATEDVELSAGKSVILRSPNGTRYRLTVSNTGALSTTTA